MIEVSVIMSCFKSNPRLLKKSIQSIKEQSYKKHELIIIDDGVSKNCKKIISDFALKDKRIKILKNKKNMGLPYSLNKAIKYSSGEFIFRADDDDFSHKDRIKIQLDYLKKNRDISVLGTNAKINLIYKKKFFFSKFPLKNSKIVKTLPFVNPIIHSSICARKKIFKKYKYDERLLKAQDYDLWQRMSKNSVILENLPNKLVTLNKLNPILLIDFLYEIKVRLKHNSIIDNLYLIFYLPFSLLKIIFNKFFNYKLC